MRRSNHILKSEKHLAIYKYCTIFAISKLTSDETRES